MRSSVVKRLLLLLAFLLVPVFAQAQITQRNWALQLIDSLGWSFGLPEKPTDADYALMLGGRRVYRIEAEDAYQRGDRVAVMNFTTFGPFSGSGWLNGIKEPSEVHLKFNLLHSGRYRVKARVRLVEHHLRFGTRDFRVSGGEQFSDVRVGVIDLQAGPQEALLLLRPNGSVDFIELAAEPFEPIQPEGGWQFDAEVTAEVAARTTIQALNLQKNLPPTGQSFKLEAENLVLPAGVRISADSNRGVASGGRYIQVGAVPVVLDFYTANVTSSVADLVLRAAGSRPVGVRVPGHLEVAKGVAPAFGDTFLGTLFLAREELTIQVKLPAGGSLDYLELRQRRAESADLQRLVGFDPSAAVSARDLNNLSALVYRLKDLH
jgi:hypothetical protein